MLRKVRCAHWAAPIRSCRTRRCGAVGGCGRVTADEGRDADVEFDGEPRVGMSTATFGPVPSLNWETTKTVTLVWAPVDRGNFDGIGWAELSAVEEIVC